MSTSYDLWLMYGFPVTHTTLTVPTRLGERAPTLGDWVDEWKADHPDSLVGLNHFGWLNDDQYMDVPFIGVEIRSKRDIRRGEIPGTRLGGSLSLGDPAAEEDASLRELQRVLGCAEDTVYAIGFYMMLRAG